MYDMFIHTCRMCIVVGLDRNMEVGQSKEAIACEFHFGHSTACGSPLDDFKAWFTLTDYSSNRHYRDSEMAIMVKPLLYCYLKISTVRTQ